MELFFLFEFIYFLKQRDFWKKSSWALMWPFRVSVWCGPSYFLNGLLCTPVNSHPGFHPSTFCFLIWGQALLSCGAIFFCLLSSQFLYYHSHCRVLLAPLSQREEQSPAPTPAPDSSRSRRAGTAVNDFSKEPVGWAVPSSARHWEVCVKSAEAENIWTLHPAK